MYNPKTILTESGVEEFDFQSSALTRALFYFTNNEDDFHYSEELSSALWNLGKVMKELKGPYDSDE